MAPLDPSPLLEPAPLLELGALLAPVPLLELGALLAPVPLLECFRLLEPFPLLELSPPSFELSPPSLEPSPPSLELSPPSLELSPPSPELSPPSCEPRLLLDLLHPPWLLALLTLFVLLVGIVLLARVETTQIPPLHISSAWQVSPSQHAPPMFPQKDTEVTSCVVASTPASEVVSALLQCERIPATKTVAGNR